VETQRATTSPPTPDTRPSHLLGALAVKSTTIT
jgi:hypothetical protein